MAIIAFVVFTAIGQLLNVLLCLWLDVVFSPMVGSLTFVGLYALVFVIAYKLALFFFDRDEPQADRKPAIDTRPQRPVPDDSWQYARTQR